METTRRNFIKQSIIASSVLAVGGDIAIPNKLFSKIMKKNPIVISTWNFGLPANEAAFQVLSTGGSSLDAVEKGVQVPEADPAVTSVGYGGLPDRNGKVTLDSCIMDSDGNCGSVAFLEHIMHPVSVARKVMELTQHVMLVGEGALEFALANGFKQENLLTPESKAAYEKWLQTQEKVIPHVDDKNHDTIGMLALDLNGNLAGACTTSGWAYKIHGRVGDSPIIGAGLFVDNEIGAATATGLGESVMKMCGSHLIVELMRNGISPQAACEKAVERIANKQKNYKEIQVGFLAISKNGEIGAFSIKKGFQYALHQNGVNKLIDAEYFVK